MTPDPASAGREQDGRFSPGVGLIEQTPIPLPPLAEQRRIVAKVDELMALCDRLQACLAAGDDTRRHLLDALLAEALTPAEAAMQAEAPRVAAHG
jgi:type I restriction enzyme S subunit